MNIYILIVIFLKMVREKCEAVGGECATLVPCVFLHVHS
jgi:hypothetical protein